MLQPASKAPGLVVGDGVQIGDGVLFGAPHEEIATPSPFSPDPRVQAPMCVPTKKSFEGGA